MGRSALVAACIAILCSCGSTPPAAPVAPAPPPTTLFVLTAPALVAPEEGAAVFQNDPDIGCPSDALMGYGYAMDFKWAAASSSAGVSSYHLFVKNRNAAIPSIDTRVTATGYTDRRCNVYVAPQFLEGWEWRVRAIDAGGTAGPWSETRTFEFVPCQIGRRPCGG